MAGRDGLSCLDTVAGPARLTFDGPLLGRRPESRLDDLAPLALPEPLRRHASQRSCRTPRRR